jgi:hypothetical protein
MESIKANIHLYKPIHFLMPFLAHALGTLVGAFVAAKVAAYSKMKVALGIGFFFMMGGLATVMMMGGPIWFTAVDLILAYIPMGWIAGKMAKA